MVHYGASPVLRPAVAKCTDAASTTIATFCFDTAQAGLLLAATVVVPSVAEPTPRAAAQVVPTAALPRHAMPHCLTCRHDMPHYCTTCRHTMLKCCIAPRVVTPCGVAPRAVAIFPLMPTFLFHGRWQDALLQAVAVRLLPQARPWLVYTAGAMGAGKSYCMRWLSTHGILRIEQMVKVDMDKFKKARWGRFGSFSS
jgi:hypothetical protein